MTKRMRTLHKWAAMLVGVQLLIWVVTGLYFNLMDHHGASGRAMLAKPVDEPKIMDILPSQGQILEPSQVISLYPETVSLTLIWRLNKSYYLLTNTSEQSWLIDASTGEKAVFTQGQITSLALASYKGEQANVLSAMLLTPPLSDFPKVTEPVWQISIDDEFDTQIYMEANTGTLIGHTNKDKKLADIMFMLHFMDYGRTGSFNHVLIQLVALMALGLSISGGVLTVNMLRKGQIIKWKQLKRVKPKSQKQ